MQRFVKVVDLHKRKSALFCCKSSQMILIVAEVKTIILLAPQFSLGAILCKKNVMIEGTEYFF